MRLNYMFTFLFLMMGVSAITAEQAVAQDTMTVQWWTGSEVIYNALRDAVIADTVDGGGRANENRVYKLLAGGVYWMTDAISNSGFHLRIVGEPGDPNDPNLPPPILQRVTPQGGGDPPGKLISGSGDLTMKNLYIIHCDDVGDQTDYQPIELSGTGRTYVFDNVIFERTNFACIAVTNPNNKVYVTNCKFRNQVGAPSDQQWQGRGISLWIDQDIVIIENNTFFNHQFTPFQLEGGTANYLRFNHNTLVNVGRNAAVAGSSWLEAYFTNNLMVNVFWHGEGSADLDDANRDPRATFSGIFGIGDLPSKYGPEEGRRIVFAYNSAWRDPKFATYYADSIVAQHFIGPVTQLDFLDLYEQMVVRDTVWLASRPSFPTYFTSTFIDTMILNIRDLREGTNPGNATPYFWMLQPPTFPSWPLPEDFSYTENLAGSDGLPLGDLNWFPADKAEFEANKDGYIWSVEKLGGAKRTFVVDTSAQAEDATLANGAAIDEFTGFSYFIMDGAGEIRWDFTMAAPATVDLKVYTHMRGNDTRGQHTRIINSTYPEPGIALHDSAFKYGELIYSNAATGSNGVPNPHAGMVIDDWTEVLWTKAMLQSADQPAFDFPAGANAIQINPSWGYQNFHGIDVLQAGTSTVLHELRVLDATFETVGLAGLGAPWVPQGLKSVALGTGGSVEWTFDVKEAGNYGLQIYYQNISGTPSGSIQADGGTALSMTFQNDADSAGLGILSPIFPLTVGSHAIKLTGNQVKVDYAQLVKETVTSVPGTGELPLNFSLEQNYPNPFNPSTTIRYSIPTASKVELNIYDLLGRQVMTLVNELQNIGTYDVSFDASHLSTGLYFYRITAGDFIQVKKMLLLK